MTKVKVIGIGSPFSADQAGFKVCEHLLTFKKLQAHCPKHLEIIKSDRPGVHLLNLLQGANQYFLIDAIQSNQPPGTLHCLSDAEIMNHNSLLSSHGLGIANVLAIKSSMGERTDNIRLFGIEVDDTTALTPPSADIKIAAVKLAKVIYLQLNLVLQGP